MGYASSPRPTFDAPTPIPYSTVTRHLWGDDDSGHVADWIYVSSEHIHQLVFGLPPGGAFRHSDAYRTVFAADEVLHVLSGELVIANPETGEVHRVLPSESVFFRRDTWHNAWNASTEELRVLELLAPPPSQGTTGSYARSRPYLDGAQYTRDEWVGRWPAGANDAFAAHTIRVLRSPDILWRMEGEHRPLLVGILASTEHLTAGVIRLLPGQQSDVRQHGGDSSLYVRSGTLHVHVSDQPPPSWHELAPGDGFYLPQGTRYQFYNLSAEPAELTFGVAPAYLPGDRA
jgi:quercetin dioxygenase-like cupin family protein